MRLPAVATVLLLTTTGCVKEMSSEERLDRESPSLSAGGGTPDAAALSKVHCDDTGDALTQARNVNRPEADRVMSYIDLYTSLMKRNATFEQAMNRNPDLNYTEGSEKLVAAREACIQQTADVKVEFETYVRELVEVPTVQEVKGGNNITVARLDFTTLRQAIETLSPDDKEALLGRVLNAEKRVAPAKEDEPAAAPATTGRKRGK
ncbi:hypothetical protein [Vitiosangium sp. GDMCC 1.1324]|uniref:hypothetical protein n=1 Tax=Vitiosangium sp. (strain GDMCC 1.1324) TaxID=2138576 RepID=UPI000D3A05E6|nr:hypothetical protein [Vitiosangium sp. GDMCC 1.1324]PTL85872.1 hypothetical protein DAT35_04050 [Vitiosangium sp. GDMCC 1.1324]